MAQNRGFKKSQVSFTSEMANAQVWDYLQDQPLTTFNRRNSSLGRNLGKTMADSKKMLIREGMGNISPSQLSSGLQINSDMPSDKLQPSISKKLLQASTQMSKNHIYSVLPAIRQEINSENMNSSNKSPATL